MGIMPDDEGHKVGAFVAHRTTKCFNCGACERIAKHCQPREMERAKNGYVKDNLGSTRFFLYKHHLYKHRQPEIWPKFILEIGVLFDLTTVYMCRHVVLPTRCILDPRREGPMISGLLVS